jgi:recombination protein RecA
MCGIIEKGGAWYTINNERIQGRAKAIQYLKDNPNLVKELQEQIYAKY